MSNYKKFTLDTIKQKLKNGEYEAAVGAMRAIGKTQELSEADKEKGRALVRKHFGVEAAPAKAPRAKKAGKKAAKKTAKKAAAKPKVARAKKAAKPAAAAATKKAVAKKAVKKTRRSKPTASAEGDTGTSTSEAVASPEAVAETQVIRDNPMPRGNIVLEMGQVISTVSESLKAMETAKRLVPKARLEHDVALATGAMTRAVKIIDKEVMTPRLSDGEQTTAATTGRKKGSKKGTRAKSSPPAQTESAVNGAQDESDLTEEEQEQLRLARATQPSAEV